MRKVINSDVEEHTWSIVTSKYITGESSAIAGDDGTFPSQASLVIPEADWDRVTAPGHNLFSRHLNSLYNAIQRKMSDGNESDFDNARTYLTNVLFTPIGMSTDEANNVVVTNPDCWFVQWNRWLHSYCARLENPQADDDAGEVFYRIRSINKLALSTIMKTQHIINLPGYPLDGLKAIAEILTLIENNEFIGPDSRSDTENYRNNFDKFRKLINEKIEAQQALEAEKALAHDEESARKAPAVALVEEAAVNPAIKAEGLTSEPNKKQPSPMVESRISMSEISETISFQSRFKTLFLNLPLIRQLHVNHQSAEKNSLSKFLYAAALGVVGGLALIVLGIPLSIYAAATRNQISYRNDSVTVINEPVSKADQAKVEIRGVVTFKPVADASNSAPVVSSPQSSKPSAFK